MDRPTNRLSASTDGAGTVAILGALTGRFSVIGQNATAMSVVDTYVSGSSPIAMTDDFSVGRLVPEEHIGVIEGIITACMNAGPCMLIGGETAELPDLFKEEWMFHVTTAVIGIPQSDIITGHVRPGQKVYGWPSHGPASNGFSLIRKIFGLKGDYDLARARLAETPTGFERSLSLADLLLVPTPVWVNHMEAQRLVTGVKFAAHAHITGGGMGGNIPRVLPPDCKVVIDRSAWKRPPIFRLIQETGNVDPNEMDRTFNQGIMVVSIIDGTTMPNAQEAIEIGTVQLRQGKEDQVQFTGKFNE